MKRFAWFSIVWMAFPLACQAQVYKCVNADSIVYQDSSCAKGRNQMHVAYVTSVRLDVNSASQPLSGWDANQINPNTARVLDQQRGELTLARNRAGPYAGHYVADGEINGRHVTFLLDTGATRVSFSSRLGRELGLKHDAAVMLQTANGTAVGYHTRLDSIRVGPIEMRDVGAVFSDGMNDETVLLGMNFLQRLELTQRGDQLTLRAPDGK